MCGVRRWVETHPRTVTVFLAVTFPVWVAPALIYMVASIVYMGWSE